MGVFVMPSNSKDLMKIIFNSLLRRAEITAFPIAISNFVLASFCLMPSALQAQAVELEAFKKIVDQCTAAWSDRPTVEVYYSEISKKWIKVQKPKAVVSYDVRKTDSLVSPLVAEIKIDHRRLQQRADDEVTAQALELTNVSGEFRSTLLLNYAYRASRWDLIDGITTESIKTALMTEFSKPSQFRIARDSVLQMIGGQTKLTTACGGGN